MSEYIKLWLAKAAVDLALWVGVMVLIVIGASASYWLDQLKKKRRDRV